MTMQQYCLRWNNHQPNFISVFSSLLNSESLVDVTLAAEGRHLQAHKVVLSACSSYFQSLFTINPCQHPIVILKDVKFIDLKVIIDFMYYGEVNVSQDQLPYILKTAEMLKIKGLAEIPVDQSVSSKIECSMDRAEVLTQADNSWTADNQHSTSIGARQSLSPSPRPLSPFSKRKRLRKTSSGSGSGSAEKIPEEMPLSADGTLTSGIGSLSSVIKSESGSFQSECNLSLKTLKSSTDSESHNRSSSQESIEEKHITLQIPQHQQELTSHIEQQSSNTLDVVGPSTSSNVPQHTVTDKPIITTHSQLSQQFLHRSEMVMGTKRGRFLMRQPRVKRESDPSQVGDESSPQYLTVPFRVERQCSDPLPSASPPGNLLTVPGAPLLKQHSHPLLPSQTQHYQKCVSPPIHIQIMQQSLDFAERAVSPIVLVTDPLSIKQELPSRGDSVSIAPSNSLRIRADDLKRSASSPQSSSTRSSHCPVVRTGPALGCNYCWNTVDTHGRILRRKTKYHCPECQTNLCIVPCFQEYHERHPGPSQTDPLALTTSVMKVFPKTTSM